MSDLESRKLHRSFATYDGAQAIFNLSETARVLGCVNVIGDNKKFAEMAQLAAFRAIEHIADDLVPADDP